MLYMHERAGIDPPPRKWVGGSFPRPRAREFCSPAPDHPKSGLLGFRVSTPQPPYQGGLLLPLESSLAFAEDVVLVVRRERFFAQRQSVP